MKGSPLLIKQRIKKLCYQTPGMVNVAVIGAPDELREEKGIAYVEVSDSSVTEDVLIKYCKEYLAALKIPQEFIFVKEFSRTSIGKIQKKILSQRYLVQTKVQN